MGLIRLGGSSELDLQREGYLFDGYLVVADALLFGREASDYFGRQLCQHGIEAVLERLNGAYRYIVKKDNSLWFGVDHFGGNSLFYQLEPEFALFDDPSSQIDEPKYCDEALCCLIASGYTVGDETIYVGIRECSSGVVYEYDVVSKSLRGKTWYKFNLRPDRDYDPTALEKAFLSSLPHLSSPAWSYLLPLSGGLDSRAILAVAIRRDFPITAFTYGLRTARDFSIAGRICTELAIKHATYPTTATARDTYFDDAGMKEMVQAMHLGRSIPEEFDWLPLRQLDHGNFVICPGHTGDWLTGGQMDGRLYRTKTLEQLVEYIFEKHFSLTAVSSSNYRDLLRGKIRSSLLAIISDNGEEPVACAERWNLEHRQKKYIVNSARKYQRLGWRAYLPFYDRELMSIFMGLKVQDRICQRAYADVLCTRLFTGRLEVLRQIENTRLNFDFEGSGDFGRESMVEKLRWGLRRFDRRKYRRRFAFTAQQGYDNPAAMLTSRDKTSFMRQKVGDAFPLMKRCTGQLHSYGCDEAARHVNWILGQKVSQMNPAGLYICAFLPYILKVG